MVDFWSNHLNVFGALAPAWTAKSLEDRVVIRKHALASFESLLLADARSAAMLMYLGNDKSRLDRPNENYGRELLELHTVGIDAGFTEADVLNSAYVLTGRTCDEKRQYYYRPDWHYVGPVKVLGWSSANSTATGGLAVGDSYLRYLARHPSTALALSRKLAIRFVSDDPPDSLVNALAEVYLANGTAIVPWLRALFGSAEFADSIGRKARRRWRMSLPASGRWESACPSAPTRRPSRRSGRSACGWTTNPSATERRLDIPTSPAGGIR